MCMRMRMCIYVYLYAYAYVYVWFCRDACMYACTCAFTPVDLWFTNYSRVLRYSLIIHYLFIIMTEKLRFIIKMSSHSLVINYLSIICPYLFTIKSPWNYPGNQTRQCNQNIHLLQQFKHIWIYGKRPLQGLPWSHWRLPYCLHIEWASALCRRPPLCGGGRAGSVNKTTGEVKTFKTYTKQTGGSSSWVQFVYLRIWEELLGFFQNRSLTGGLRILALRSDAKPTFTVAISGRNGIGSKCYFHLGNVLSLGLCFN